MARRPQITYESRIEQAKLKIKEKPQNALKEIGKLLVIAIRNKAAKSSKKRTYYNKSGQKVRINPGKLKRSIGYWFRKKEGDVQVGSKVFYSTYLEFGSSKNRKQPFLMPAIEENVGLIQSMITDALKELEREP